MMQRLSGFFFYLLGASLFAAVVMLKNSVYPDEAAVWLQVADLPFALSALTYGGTSLYRSLTAPTAPSKTIAWAIGVALTVVFTAIVTLNFWPGK